MLLKYFYNEKLAQASYFVGCQETAEAIIVDPARDVRPYLKFARREGMRIIGATETHIHADFVSGARELAEQTGATLYLSDNGDQDWKYQFAGHYEHVLLCDGDSFMIGNLKFDALHTPGHTPEHISLLITDTAGADQPMGIFSGDFVFVGDVGRPDLLEKAANIADTAETGARQMFQSLRRFKELPDYLQLWPGHGAGSACGKDLGAVPSSTVGYEKLFNWALSQSDEDAFVCQLLADQPEPPRYFGVMKRVNKEGPALLRTVPTLEQLPFGKLKEALPDDLTVVDARSFDAFSAGHIPGTINIPYDYDFANWAGWLVDYDQPFYLITGQNMLKGLSRELASIGLDNGAGYFDTSVLESWAAAGGKLQSYELTTPTEIAGRLNDGQVTLVDVRNQSEWDEGHIPGAQHLMLGYLAGRFREIPPDKPVVVQCESGNRSAIGASILQAKGITDVANLKGGISRWRSAGLPVTVD